jgi:hypothetical protein
MQKKVMILSLALLSSPSYATDLFQQFKNPAFSGFGWSSHVMSIEAQERGREQSIRDAERQRIALEEAARQNTPLARFINLFTSQVYAQLATQLSTNLFSGTSASNTGSFVLDGNTISYVKTGAEVILTVIDAAGNQTIVSVPIASFAF